MEANNENQQKFDSLDKAKDKLTENLTGILEKYDEKLDLHELAIELSEVTDRGNELYKEMDAFMRTLVGPGFEDDKATAAQLEPLMDGLQKLLDEDLPDLLKQRLAEERDQQLFGPILKGAKKEEMEPALSHKADMFMYTTDLNLIKDPAIDGSLLDSVFNDALEYAVSDLDADGQVRTWGALQPDVANLAVDKKWIASHPKVADRVASLYLAALDHQDIPRLQEFEELLKTYDLLNIIGSPLKEQYQKQLSEIKKRG